MARHRFSTFWTGRASPYQTLCLSTWIAHGFDVTVYTSGAEIILPAGAKQRPAKEILDLGGHIHRYKTGFGAGSPSLHSNLFRYMLLLRDEWWLDTDVVMLRDQPPAADFFVARQANNMIGSSILRLPPDLPLIQEAIDEAFAKVNEAKWSQIGPALITRLIDKHGLNEKAANRDTAYAIDYSEAIMFFDPAARSKVEERTSASTFVHLWNEIWNAIGFPQELGPPEGSYLDMLFETYIGRPFFKARVPFPSIQKWWNNRVHILQLEEELARTDRPAVPSDSKRG